MQQDLLSFFNQFQTKQKLYIYGAGKLGEMFYQVACHLRPDIKVAGFLSTSGGGTCCGMRVESLEQYLSRQAFDNIIVICTSFWNQIVGNISARGLDNFLVFSLLMENKPWNICSDSNHYARYADVCGKKQNQVTSYLYEKCFDEQIGYEPDKMKNVRNAMVSDWIKEIHPSEILDVASDRVLTLGLTSFCDVVSLDYRARSNLTPNESVLVGDALDIPKADNSFEVVMCINAHYTFGTCLYTNEEFDWEASRKAVSEMIRVVRPGGFIIISCLINRRPTYIMNPIRIFDHADIMDHFDQVELIKEAVIINRDLEMGMRKIRIEENVLRIATVEELPDLAHGYHNYVGLFQKPLSN